MAKPRMRPNGRWELSIRHPALPGGRRSYMFDTEREAVAYEAQWRARKLAGLPPPVEMLAPVRVDRRNLGMLLRAFESSGLAAPSQVKTLRLLEPEVGLQPITELSHRWVSEYIRSLKTGRNLAPGSIRHRIQAISRVIEHFMAHHPGVLAENPCEKLPRGYASYTDVDVRLAEAAGGRRREDVARDRRLAPGEEARIMASLMGEQPDGRDRALRLYDGDALAHLFVVIVGTGLRLLEAVRLQVDWIDLDRRVMRVQSSKQWRGAVRWRNVPLLPAVHAVLHERIVTRGIKGFVWPFVDQAGGDIQRASHRLSARFTIAFRHAGIMDLHEHDLRHEATCRWLELRDAVGNWLLRDAEINRIMGWALGSTMAVRYASFRADDMAARIWAATAVEGRSGG